MTSRMVIGVTIPTVSFQGIANCVFGLKSCVMSYFTWTAEQQEHWLNQPWNDPINGDAAGNFRVYYQNVHGIPCDDVSLQQELQALAEYDVGCMCLLETNIDWNQPYIQSDFLSRQQKTWTYASTSFSSIDMESSWDYMTGGMLTSSVDKWSSQVFDKNSNPSGMGWWSYQMLMGKWNTKVTIITGYQCMQNSSSSKSVWTQERIFMQDQQSKSAPAKSSKTVHQGHDWLYQQVMLPSVWDSS